MIHVCFINEIKWDFIHLYLYLPFAYPNTYRLTSPLKLTLKYKVHIWERKKKKSGKSGLPEKYRTADHQTVSASPASANMFVSLGNILSLICFVDLSVLGKGIGHGKFYNQVLIGCALGQLHMLGEAKNPGIRIIGSSALRCPLDV